MINLLYQTWINNVPISNSVPPHKRKMSGDGYGNVKCNYLEKMLEVVGIEWKALTVDNFDPNEISFFLDPGPRPWATDGTLNTGSPHFGV